MVIHLNLVTIFVLFKEYVNINLNIVEYKNNGTATFNNRTLADFEGEWLLSRILSAKWDKYEHIYSPLKIEIKA